MRNSIVIISKDFSFSYGKQILFEIENQSDDFIIEEGKIYGIYGENGCGKTTLLNLINTFDIPTSGKITYYFEGVSYVHGVKFNNKINSKLISNNIRRSFQVPLLIDELTAYENILLSKREFNLEAFSKTFNYLKRNSHNLKITELLKIGNLLETVNVGTISYGQRKIVSNLQVLYSSAKLLILDEPFANLHYDVIQKLKHEYIKMKKERQATIIIVEHRPENLKNFADEIICIHNHKIVKLN